MNPPVGAARPRRGARFLVLLLATAVLAGLPWLFPSGKDHASSPSTAAVENAPHPLIGKYCMSCHDDVEHAAGLAFDGMDLGRAGTDAETWEKVVRKLSAGVMPPAGNPRPS